MIKWIKGDFRAVRANLSYRVGKKIPLGIAILYYIIVGLIALPLSLGLLIWLKIYTIILVRKYKKLSEEV